MTPDFVTIATYDTPPRAHLALGLLREAGIDAMLRNEEIVAGAWDLGQASRGVEVRVPRDEAQRAHAMVEEAAFHGGVKGSDAAGELAEYEEAPDPRTPDEREDGDLSTRALHCAAFGIVLPPLQLYSLWLLGRLWLRGVDRPLRKEVVKQMRDALLMDLVVVVEIVLIVFSRA